MKIGSLGVLKESIMGENNWESLQLPMANVDRIMKKIVPQKAKISKEAKKAMQECANEFISFVTNEAAQRCANENRRTLNGDDICWAFGSYGLDNYGEILGKYLLKFREIERIKASNKAITFQDDHQQGLERSYNDEQEQQCG